MDLFFRPSIKVGLTNYLTVFNNFALLLSVVNKATVTEVGKAQ